MSDDAEPTPIDECSPDPPPPSNWVEATNQVEDSTAWENSGVAERQAQALFMLAQQCAAFLDHLGVPCPYV